MKLLLLGNYRQLSLVSLLLAALILLQGCAGTGRAIAVTSTPQGAEVLADGRKIGTTPMQLSQSDTFPARWYGSSYMVKGKLQMMHPGCDDFSMKVDDMILLKDIDAQLKCRPGMHKNPQVEVLPMSQHHAPPAATTKTMDAEIERRLARLQALLDKAVISKDEYTEQRKRILDSL